MRGSLPYVPSSCVLLTKSDTLYLDTTFHSFLVETDGIIKFIGFEDSAAVELPVLAGIQYTMSIKQVFDTGTTSGNVWGFR